MKTYEFRADYFNGNTHPFTIHAIDIDNTWIHAVQYIISICVIQVTFTLTLLSIEPTNQSNERLR